ncbi:MAG: DUF3800 domain-containing protein [Phycisphaerae bacterium]|nr:DUF3800 domain-containing protein [Phycisphaerae bacterium]
MYFFYIDESGTRDPEVAGTKPDGTAFTKEHLYVLTAVSLFEGRWKRFDREISNLKLELADHLRRIKNLKFDLADCEVKSTWLRIKKQREAQSPFLTALSEADRTRLGTCLYDQLRPHHMRIFSVAIDKRKLHDHMDHHKLHRKAYELLLERIENYLREFHYKHNGVIVMDDTDKTINRGVAMKHAFFQREGNPNVDFRHILEYPFFTDSKLSNGVQLADLCGYNVYRALRNMDFDYPFFKQILPQFYISQQTAADKLDGLKVFPDDSDLVSFAREGWAKFKAEQPANGGGL